MNIEYFLDHITSDNEGTEDVDILFSSNSDSSSEDDLEHGNQRHAKVPNFIQTVESYSNTDFKSHFRLNRSTVLNLIKKYKLTMEMSVGPGHPKLDAKLDIYIFLWYISNTITFRQLANLFGVAKSTAWNVVVRVTDFLVDNGAEYLKWPSHEESKITSAKFEQIKRIPNIIGVIDGTHIKIKAPRENSVYYYNRKKFFSISMQVIVDANKKFIDIYCGEPGSYHDGRVLRRSTIYHGIEENRSLYFQTNQFILGDSAYPVKDWLVPPFKDNGTLTNEQRQFNKYHSSTRVLVENAIGLLKTRFRRLLHFSEHIDLKLLTKIVYSACILHNICLSENDVFEVDDSVPETALDMPEEDTPLSTPSLNRRDRLYIELREKNIL